MTNMMPMFSLNASIILDEKVYSGYRSEPKNTTIITTKTNSVNILNLPLGVHKLP
jgi:hypothetical protein